VHISDFEAAVHAFRPRGPGGVGPFLTGVKMQIVEMKEAIKVRADFIPGGKVVPLLFKRRGQGVFQVRRVNSTWEDKEQEHKLLYFSVNTDKCDDVFQLCFREEDRTWWLECVMLDG